MDDPVVLEARRLADERLFPEALHTDAAERVAEPLLGALANAGLFGLVGPPEHGGLGLALGAGPFSDVVEALASGCLATTFVWVQHHGALHALATSDNTALARAWLPDLCAGRRRAGLALSGSRPGPDPLRARPEPGGWRLEGRAPWMTGWGLVDAVLTTARTDDERALSAWVEPRASDTLEAAPQRLLAANASCTVELGFHSHFVPDERVVALAPYVPPPPHDAGGRSNGSFALGVARRACQLLGPSPLDAELHARRRQLDGADDERLAAARAAAVELSLRASAALITSQGSRSIVRDAHAQRLAREALFLLVFGSRPAIKQALLGSLLGTLGVEAR
jgi:alkylation response protein AidB-like acyl-CoA dehydrogenase